MTVISKMSIVHTDLPFSSGPVPNDVIFVGEAPGKTEYGSRFQDPFIGPAGRLQRLLLSKLGVDVDEFYLTNLSKTFNRGNPDPSDEEVERWDPVLMEELACCEPKLIVTVGLPATVRFLGSGRKISEIHGVLHELGAFDKGIKHELASVVDAKVLPIVHPAAGLRTERMREMVFTDYMEVVRVIKTLQSKNKLTCPTINRFPLVDYRDVSGNELAHLLSNRGRELVMAIDTEGRPGKPWSIQICFEPAEVYCLRYVQDDFDMGIASLYRFMVKNQLLVVIHCANTPMGCMYDITMCREMGLDLAGFDMFDSMYDAYLKRTEPQGLKALMWRCAGLDGGSYKETVSSIGGMVEYLRKIVDMDLPSPGVFSVRDPNGSKSEYSPRSLSSRAAYYLNKVELGQPEDWDLYKKWNEIAGQGDRLEIQEELREELEFLAGPMPESTLDDIPVEDAVRYACLDADATLRIFLARGGFDAVTEIHRDGIAVLKNLELMQQTGMPVDPEFFEDLILEINGRLTTVERDLSVKYNGGRPINPRSNPDVSALLELHNVKVKKTTASGAPSTSSDSMEHLRSSNELVDLVFVCRELRNDRDKFCKVVLKSRDEDDHVHCHLAISTASRRPTARDPNMLAVSKKDRYGWNIRDGFICRTGEVFGAFDYGQQEMRWMAHLSEDQTLCKFFTEGRDVHHETAKLVFGVGNSGLKPGQRGLAKTVNFGLIYGATAFRLANELQSKGLTGWTVDRCTEFIDEVLGVYPGIRRYKEDVIRFVQNFGFIRDHWGMIRYLPGIWSPDKGIRHACEREAVNLTIQGGAQGQMHKAMIWLAPQVARLRAGGVSVRECLQVHDEMLYIIATTAVRHVRDLVLEGLINHGGVKLRVPVTADCGFSRRWGGAK